MGGWPRLVSAAFRNGPTATRRPTVQKPSDHHSGGNRIQPAEMSRPGRRGCTPAHPARIPNREAKLKPDRPLIFSVLLLAGGLAVIFGYCHGNTGLTAAYPFSGTVLHVDFTTVGPGVLGGLALTALGALLLAWSFIVAILSQMRLLGAHDAPPERLMD